MAPIALESIWAETIALGHASTHFRHKRIVAFMASECQRLPSPWRGFGSNADGSDLRLGDYLFPPL
jgi:hypothetical protein